MIMAQFYHKEFHCLFKYISNI